MQVIPQHFKHSNYTSFVRQLNMYNFHKTTANPQIAEFFHPYFQRGRAEILHLIKRKPRSGKKAAAAGEDDADDEEGLHAPSSSKSSAGAGRSGGPRCG